MYDVVHLKLCHELIELFDSEYWKVAVEESVYRVYTRGTKNKEERLGSK